MKEKAQEEPDSIELETTNYSAVGVQSSSYIPIQVPPRPPREPSHYNTGASQSGPTRPPRPNPAYAPSIRKPMDSQAQSWLIPYSHLTIQHQLGQGGFGIVYKVISLVHSLEGNLEIR